MSLKQAKRSFQPGDILVASDCKTIGDYLVYKIQSYGVRHVFGVPGDYVLGLYDTFQKSSLQVINTSDEQGAGFAADAYARANGMGVVCITYCVGGLKVANSTAQAYAEKSPVVVISGSPGLSERMKYRQLHHMVQDYDTQLQVFKRLTVDAVAISKAESAVEAIDRAFEKAWSHKQPVYIELPRDLERAPYIPKQPSNNARIPEPIDVTAALDDAVKEIVTMIYFRHRAAPLSLL
jgi:TPP-dependent 2-oxoacid decarboxylase